jgi:hypothetical protein
MAKSVSNTGNNEVVLNLINSTELQKLFFELQDKVQMKVLNDAFKKSGKIILDTAKANFNATKKNLSKTKYSALSRSFKSKALRKEIGMVFGMQHREGYKYRFLNYGTVARFTKNGSKKRYTGTIKPSNFFTNAVTSQAENAQKNLSNEIVLSLERVVKKYEKNTGATQLKLF